MAQGKAKTVYNTEYIRLQDGTELEVRDLPIKQLRKAQALINKAIAGHEQTDEDGEPILNDKKEPVVEVDEDEVFDAFFTVVEMVMRQKDNISNCGKFLEPDNGREELENTLDQNTLYEIVRASTGYDFLKMQKMVQEMLDQGVSL